MNFLKSAGCLGAAIMLASCGGSGEDFTVDVEAPPTEAYADLSSLNGGMLTSALRLDPIRKVSGEEGEIKFVIPGGEHDDGTLDITVSDNGAGGSRVSVALDLPYISRSVAGGTEFLSETKAEDTLRDEMRAWAQAKSMGGAARAELDVMDGTLGAFAIAIQRWDGIDDAEIMMADADIGAMFGAEDSESSDWGSDESSSAGEPMSDPSGDAGSFGEPMDNGSSYDGYDDDDGGWGEAS